MADSGSGAVLITLTTAAAAAATAGISITLNLLQALVYHFIVLRSGTTAGVSRNNE
jgi:hypothetical protein